MKSKMRNLLRMTLIFVFAGLFLIWPGCQQRDEQKMLPAKFEAISVGGHDYQICTIDLRAAQLNLYWKNSDGMRYANFASLKDSISPPILFATNAGIFDPTFTPCGLHVEHGHELVPINLSEGKGNFYMKPNGVFLIDRAGAKIIESSQYPGTTPGVQLATQSGPLLVIDGKINANFAEDSSNRRIRSGVGVDESHTVIFAISKDSVTFMEFATLFKDRLHCPMALYLDGEISRFFNPSSASNAADDSEENFTGLIAATAR